MRSQNKASQLVYIGRVAGATSVRALVAVGVCVCVCDSIAAPVSHRCRHYVCSAAAWSCGAPERCNCKHKRARQGYYNDFYCLNLLDYITNICARRPPTVWRGITSGPLAVVGYGRVACGRFDGCRKWMCVTGAQPKFGADLAAGTRGPAKGPAGRANARAPGCRRCGARARGHANAKGTLAAAGAG